jgi:hypothetical protein
MFCPKSDVHCCYFCRKVKECYSKWKEGRRRECLVYDELGYCCVVEGYIDEHGFDFVREKVQFD